MKRYTVFATILLAACVMVFAFAAESVEKKEGKGLLRHVVCFKFKEEATQDQIGAVCKAFEDLEKKIDVILDFEMGTNVSPENLNKDFTHCFMLTFKTAKDRDFYLEHPDHKAFGKVLGPTINGGQDVFVIDYWTK